MRIDGRPTSLGFGCYPVVTLAMTRERALQIARATTQCHDPCGVPTFDGVLETVVAIYARTWKGGGSE